MTEDIEQRLKIARHFADALADQPALQPAANAAIADAYQCGFNAGRKSAEILPPNKPWVGLTDEDMKAWPTGWTNCLRWAEAKLREKNQ